MCPGRTKNEWSREWELNPRPADYESAALPLSYLGPFIHDSIRRKSLSIHRGCASVHRINGKTNSIDLIADALHPLPK
jgi:hypothetical protein